jgi:hypothetical protein
MQDLVDELNGAISVNLVQGDTFSGVLLFRESADGAKGCGSSGSFFIDASLKDRAVAAEGTSMFLESEAGRPSASCLRRSRSLSTTAVMHNGELSTQVDANRRGSRNASVAASECAPKPGIATSDRQRDLQRSIRELTAAAEAAIGRGSRWRSRPAAPYVWSAVDMEEALRQMLLVKKATIPMCASYRGHRQASETGRGRAGGQHDPGPASIGHQSEGEGAAGRPS